MSSCFKFSKVVAETVCSQFVPEQTVAGGSSCAYTAYGEINVGRCAAGTVKTDGTLWLWGNGTWGALGDNTIVSKSSPVQTVAGGTNWCQVSVGFDGAAGVKTDGTLWIWGENYYAVLGNNTITPLSSPIQTVAGGTNWKWVGKGTNFTLAIKCDGTMWGWGRNCYGAVGDNTNINRSSPVQNIANSTAWKQAAAGAEIAAAIKCDGSLWMWGNGTFGNFGNNLPAAYPTGLRSSPVQTVSGGTDWKQVGIDSGRSIHAVKTNGTLWAWGGNDYGELGTNDRINRSSPVQTITGTNKWVEVCASVRSTFAKKYDGTLWGWGRNTSGQLLTTDRVHRSSPVQEFTLSTNWKQISTSCDTVGAIKTDGTLWMWGCGTGGGLGNNSIINQSSPVQTVTATTDWKASCYYTDGWDLGAGEYRVQLGKISSGPSFHTATIKLDGTLWLWGSGGSGKLGDNASVNRSSPVQTISGGTDWKEVDTGGFHTVAIKTDGSLWTWGSGSAGQRGDEVSANRSSPVQTVAGGNDWSLVSSGYSHNAAIKLDGTLWLWGCGGSGRLGNNSTANQSSPVQTVTGGTDWKQVNLGAATTAVIKNNGSLWIWGIGSNGRLGTNDLISQSSPVQTISGGTNWQRVTLGDSHSGAIKTDGTLWLWGCGFAGQLGDNTLISKSSPVQTIAGGTDWNFIDLSHRHVIAIKCGGSLWSWGCGGSGQLGNNSTANQSSPVQTVSGGTDWAYVSGLLDHTTAIKNDGTLWIWGSNTSGQLGTDYQNSQSSPVQTVSATTDWKCSGYSYKQYEPTVYGEVAVGLNHSGSVKADGTLWMWGGNAFGQLADGTNTSNRSSPVQTIASGNDWKYLCLGNCHSVAIKCDGTLWSWGASASGVHGDELNIHQSSPVQTVAGGTNWKQVSTGTGTTLAVKDDGTLWGWGCNLSYKLGDGTPYHRSSPIQTLSGGTNWKSASTGDRHSAAIKTDGTLWVWGQGFRGELGRDNINNINCPVQTVSGGTNWKQAEVRDEWTAAIKTDGTLWTWGCALDGRLGNNTNVGDISSPVQTVAGGTNWSCISIGCRSIVALKCDGTLWGWGKNTAGEIGNHTTIETSSPVQEFTGSTNWKKINSMSNLVGGNTIGIKTDGRLWIWGDGFYTQLGNASTIDRSSPVQTVSATTEWRKDTLIEYPAGYFGQTATGLSSTLTIKGDGTLWSWGCNSQGQLADNSVVNRSSPTQTIANDLDNKWIQVSGKNTTFAGIKADGTLWTWGNNIPGLLGNGNRNNQSSPVQTVAGGTTWTHVGMGQSTAAAVKADGTLWMWGCNNCGELGNNSVVSSSSPVQTISGGTDWKYVGEPLWRTAAGIKCDGTLWLWGTGSNGALGNNDTANQSSPVQTIAGGTNWCQIALGCLSNAAIKCDGTLWTWGWGFQGQNGNNDSSSSISSPVQTVAGGTNWKQVSRNSFRAGAVKTDGTLWLWGSNSNGELGINSVTNQSSPVQTVAGGNDWYGIAMGNFSTTAIKCNGRLWAWGDSSVGQLGNEVTTTDMSSPVQTVSATTEWYKSNYDAGFKFGSASTGLFHTSSIKADGTLWSWGEGAIGQLGDNTNLHRSSPVQTISGGTNWKQVSVYYASSAIKCDGTLWLWGPQGFGILGNHTSTGIQSSPVQTISGGTDWQQVSMGCYHAGAVKTDGTLWMWGYESNGRLGTNVGSLASISSPVQTIAGGTNWKQVSAAKFHSGAVKTDGTLWMWGYNGRGHLGNNSVVTVSSPVQTIAGGTDWKSISVAYRHSVAIKCDGTLWAWGTNFCGELADHTISAQSSPVQTVSGGTNWICASAGHGFTSGVKSDGTLWTWGMPTGGRLGNNDQVTRQSSPVQTISSGTDWIDVEIGFGTGTAIKKNGTLWTWGCNNCGGLGNNSVVPTSSPVQTVSATTEWKYDLEVVDDAPYKFGQVSWGDQTLSAIKTDGTLWFIGRNTCGKIGNNSIAGVTSSPVQTVSVGSTWCCARTAVNVSMGIKTDGTLWIWGSNYCGVMGDGFRTRRSSPVQTLAGGNNWCAMDHAGFTAAGVKTDGTLWIWGSGGGGLLGNNSQSNQSSPVQTIAKGTNWKTVSIGGGGVSAIKCDGTLWNWGRYTGDGTYTRRSSPVQTISGGTDWKSVTNNFNHTGAIKCDGTLWMWGSPRYGRLGNNDGVTYIISPVQTVAGGNNWKQHQMGLCHSVAIKTDGTLWTWGYQGYGRLGNNVQAFGPGVSSPIQTVAGGTNWKCLGRSDYTSLAFKTDGSLWGWGYDDFYGILRVPPASASSPVQMTTVATEWRDIQSHIASFAVSSSSMAAIKNDGTLWTWGGDINGKLGTNTRNVHQSSPVQTIAGGTNWKQVTQRPGNTAAIKTDGTLWIWGDGISGMLGNNNVIAYSSPIQTIAGGTNWKHVSLGNTHTMAIKCDGTLWVWGCNFQGQLGINTNVSISSPAQTIAGGNNWKHISTGCGLSAAIKTNGTLWMWGTGTWGRLGNHCFTNQSSPVQTVSGGTNWRQVSVTEMPAAIKTDGTLWVWGSPYRGGLGNNTSVTCISSPVQTIAGGTDWKVVSSGRCGHAAIKADGTIWAWGGSISPDGFINNTGGIFTPSSPVQLVTNASNWKNLQIAGTIGMIAAINENDELYTWGNNYYGTLGKNTIIAETTQTGLKAIDFDDVFVRKDVFSSGGLFGNGSNLHSRLGNNSAVNVSSPVQTIAGGTNWKFITSMGARSTGIKTDGTLWNWGYNYAGAMGDNSRISRSSPVQTVSGGTDWKVADGDGFTTAAIKTDGSLWLWGSNTSGQLGIGDRIAKSSPVQTITGGSSWKDVKIGTFGNTIALKTDGTLWGWGNNTGGQLADGTAIRRSSPVQTIAGGTNWKSISAEGGGHVGAIKCDGSLWMWGNNDNGELGDLNTFYQKSSPVQTVAGGYNWKQVSTGQYFTTAIKTDGTLWTWGRGNGGRLGDNTSVSKSSPVQTVAGGTSWKCVSSSDATSIAVKTDGTVWGWGYNDNGRSINYTAGALSSPVQTLAGGTDWKQIIAGSYSWLGIREGCW